MRLLAMLALAGLVAAPAAGYQVTRYAHLDDVQEEFPLRSDAPAPESIFEGSLGTFAHSTRCLPDVLGLSQRHHVWYGFLATSADDGQSQRGLPFDIRLDPDGTPVFFWYVTRDDVESGAPMPPIPITMDISMRTGDSGRGEDGFNAGDLIAQGRSDPLILMPGQGAGTVGGREVFAFHAPLELQATTIPRGTGAHVEVSLSYEVPGCDESMLLDHLALHSSEGFRPRLVMDVANPVRVEFIHPTWNGSIFRLHVNLQTIDTAPTGIIEAVLVGPDGLVPVRKVGEETTSHLSLVWEADMTDQPAGEYRWNVTVAGEQAAAATFQHGGDRDVPALPLPYLLMIAAGAGLGRRIARRTGDPSGCPATTSTT